MLHNVFYDLTGQNFARQVAEDVSDQFRNCVGKLKGIDVDC